MFLARDLWVLLLALVVLAPVQAHAASGDDTAEQRKLVERIRARLDASARGDTAQWATFVDDDCICGLETKATIQRAIATRLPSVKNWYGEILDFRARFLGETAVARYRISEHTEVGEQLASLQVWRTETYARRKEGWILIAGADTIIPPEPAAVKVDPRVLDGYVGRYQYTQGSVDVVTREGDRLFVQPSGEPRVELFAETETTYFAKGEPWRLIFVKDQHGAVKSLVFQQQGQEWTAVAASTVPAQLDAILKDYDRADAPGASVLVALDGKVLYRKAFGLANLEERTPITTATNFRLASVTKQFTAAAVLLLAERGKLSLDDPLTRFFPGFASFASTAHGVKVRHLLGHTSGLLDYEDLIPPGTTVPLKDKDVLDLVGKQDRLYFAPGSQFRYSNTGYALLALIVEKVSGRSFAQFLEENIFDPLGMAGTVAYEEGISKVARRAYGYSETEGRFERTDQSLTSSVLGDGGIYSSVEDLWRWDQALYGTRLLPAETLAMAFQAGTPTSDQDGSGYGYGWYVASHRGTRKVWHYGETRGFSTYLARYPDKRLTIIMLTNRNDNFLGPTVDRIADVILGARD